MPCVQNILTYLERKSHSQESLNGYDDYMWVRDEGPGPVERQKPIREDAAFNCTSKDFVIEADEKRNLEVKGQKIKR